MASPMVYHSPQKKGGWGEQTNRLANANQEITRLNSKPNLTDEERNRLQALTEEQQQLENAILREGIAARGLSEAENPFPEGECTWYATSRRNLYPAVSGHAKYWAEQAAAAGVEIGEMPVKGALMVWQPGVFKADAEFGHVSFVEQVEQMLDGSYKVFYTDNLNPDTIRTITMQPGEVGVEFIYS
jgi:hypothetical protein